ncbi:MAG: formyltransferase family protein [Saccharofermentanales bacterium]
MMNEVEFKRAIVIGTSTIAFKCIELLNNYLPVESIEYQYMDFSPLQRLCSNISVPFRRMNIGALHDYLLNITENILIVSAFNTYIFPPDIVNKKNIRIVNYHNSLLPKYAGRNAEAWVIYMQEKETGITWHRVSNIVDGGEILCQEYIILDDYITSLQLLKIQHELAFLSFKRILLSILSDENGYPQNENALDYYNSNKVPGDGEINLNWSIKKICSFLRSFDYGSLNLLGMPFIIIDGYKYCWKKYKWIDTFSSIKENVLTMNKNSIIIFGNNASIILQDIKYK